MKIYFDVLYGDLNMDMVPNMDHGHFYMVGVGTGVRLHSMHSTPKMFGVD